jgi:hypothetical protein
MALADPSVYKKAAEAILADKDPRSRVTRLTQLRDALDGQAVTQVEVVQACVPVLLECVPLSCLSLVFFASYSNFSFGVCVCQSLDAD